MLCVMPVLSAAVSLHQVSLVDLLYTVHAVDSYRGYKMLDLNREDSAKCQRHLLHTRLVTC